MSRERGARVFVGRLSHRAGERDVERFFKGYGRIREINMKNGFAFIEFDDYRDADDAVHDLNNKDLLGDRVTVEHARPTKPSGYRSGGGGGGSGGGGGRRDWGGGSGGGGGGGSRGFTFRDKYGAPYNTEWRCLVENLSTRAGWQDLKDYMRQAGDVTFSQCHKDRAGEGVVEFACEEDMKRAIRKLDGTELMGKRVRLSESTRGGGGQRRRSRSRSPRRFSRSPRRSQSRSPRRSRSPRSGSRSPRRASHSPSPNHGTSSPRRSPHGSPAANRSPSPAANRDANATQVRNADVE